MVVSTDAILFYGIAYDDDFEPERFGDDVDYEALYASKKGILPPAEECSPETRMEFRLYWQKCAAINGEARCSVGTCCSIDYPQYYVYIKLSRKVAHRGEAIEIGFDGQLTAHPGWKWELKEYCDLMGLEYREPKWLLVSNWS